MTTTSKTRAKKTLQQRAQEELDTAQRAVNRLTSKRDTITARRGEAMQKAKTDLEAIEPQLVEAQALLAHAKTHPALKKTEHPPVDPPKPDHQPKA